MNGSVKIRDRYNTHVARRHMAICCSARFRGLHQFFKNVIERFRNLPARIVLSDPPGWPCPHPPVHGLPVSASARSKVQDLRAVARGTGAPEYHISVVGVDTEAALNLCARPRRRIISIYYKEF